VKKRFLLVLVCLSFAMAACNAAPAPISTEVATELATEEATPTVEATREDTPINRGEVLFRESRGGFACATCHYTTTSRLLGPGLADIEERFASYGLEMTVEDYINVSIISPVAFLAPADPAYPANLMPTNYGELLSAEEISDLIAYILSL
jgi:mono/diheme cytochrome c family protein